MSEGRFDCGSGFEVYKIDTVHKDERLRYLISLI